MVDQVHGLFWLIGISKWKKRGKGAALREITDLS